MASYSEREKILLVPPFRGATKVTKRTIKGPEFLLKGSAPPNKKTLALTIANYTLPHSHLSSHSMLTLTVIRRRRSHLHNNSLTIFNDSTLKG
jgi:hypothetical protein